MKTKTKKKSSLKSKSVKRLPKRASRRSAKPLAPAPKKVFTAARTRTPIRYKRPGNSKRTPAAIRIAENAEAIVALRIAGHSLYDIAQARDLSVPRVSIILRDQLAKMRESADQLSEDLLELELIRIDQMILSWHRRARVDARASDVYHMWLDKRHKLLGLNINKTEIGGFGGGPLEINASRLDLSKLNDEQLGWLETIMSIAGPQTDNSVVAEMPSIEQQNYETAEITE